MPRPQNHQLVAVDGPAHHSHVAQNRPASVQRNNDAEARSSTARPTRGAMTCPMAPTTALHPPRGGDPELLEPQADEIVRRPLTETAAIERALAPLKEA